VKTEFKKSFTKNLKKRALEKNLLAHFKEIIEAIEHAQSVHEISNFKKLKAEGGYYRIRIVDYRNWLKVEDETIVFVRVLHTITEARFNGISHKIPPNLTPPNQNSG
jgi:mRNA interferase RelE/StbE